MHYSATEVLFGQDFPAVFLMIVIVAFLTGIGVGIHKAIEQQKAAKAAREEEEE